MATKKHRFTISLDRARAKTLQRFAQQWDLDVSQVINAILEPVIQGIAWEQQYGHSPQAEMFPESVVDLFELPDDLDRRDSLYRMEAAFEALRKTYALSIEAGFPQHLLPGSSEIRADGEDRPDRSPVRSDLSASEALSGKLPPHTNRGVTLSVEALPLPLPQPKKASKS